MIYYHVEKITPLHPNTSQVHPAYNFISSFVTPVLILSTHLYYILHVISALYVFRLKLCTNFLSPSSMLHAPIFMPSSICCPYVHITKPLLLLPHFNVQRHLSTLFLDILKQHLPQSMK
jgi:hypothetical protein